MIFMTTLGTTVGIPFNYLISSGSQLPPTDQPDMAVTRPKLLTFYSQMMTAPRPSRISQLFHFRVLTQMEGKNGRGLGVRLTLWTTSHEKKCCRSSKPSRGTLQSCDHYALCPQCIQEHNYHTIVSTHTITVSSINQSGMAVAYYTWGRKTNTCAIHCR